MYGRLVGHLPLHAWVCRNELTLNVALSLVLCMLGVWLGHLLGARLGQ